ncbi:MAG TPA: hypothetical protein VL098_12520 [Flavipsychrobacter sp.]|nr:hypothetical protein [Flavipsychrobacter sp.]
MKHNIARAGSWFCLLILMFWTMPARAQQALPEMADGLRSDGKIYVVVLVLATIFAGLIIYLIRLDRKISHLEKSK